MWQKCTKNIEQLRSFAVYILKRLGNEQSTSVQFIFFRNNSLIACTNKVKDKLYYLTSEGLFYGNSEYQD